MANESASLNTLNTVYRWVVDDVVKNVRDDFLNEGIDQQVLDELKTLWQGKIDMSRAVNRPSKHHLSDPPPSSSKEGTPRAIPQLIPMEKAALLPQVGSGSVIQRAPPRQPPTPPTSTPSPSTQQTIIIPQGYPVYSIGPGGNILGMTTSSPTQPTVVTAAAMQQQRPPGLPQFMPQLMMSHPGGGAGLAFPQGAAQVIVPTSQGAMVMPLPLPTILAMQQQQQAVIAAARQAQAQARAQKETLQDKVQQIDGPPPPVSNSGHHDNHATSQCLIDETPSLFRVHSSNDESLPCLAAEQEYEKTECITGKERDHSDVQFTSSNPRSIPNSTRVRLFPGKDSSKRCERERGDEIVQLDGACGGGGSSSEDDSDGDEDTTDEEIENTVDDDPLNSDDDLDDVGSDKSDEGFETQDVVICQWEKVYRVKSKWKFILKDGIMNVGGHDYVFQKVTGEADW